MRTNKNIRSIEATMDQQHQNHHLRKDSNRSRWGGLNAFYWRQTFALDSAVVKNGVYRAFPTYAIHHHRGQW